MGKVITVAQQKGGSGKTTMAANLAVALVRAGYSVTLLDLDPQGSLGRWFMMRVENAEAKGNEPDMDLSTASAWGASYQLRKLTRAQDFVVVDTPPKVDSDLRPALRESDLVLVPVATSQVDVWALDAILDLADRERVPTLVLLNRYKKGTRVSEEVTASLQARDVQLAEGVIGDRVIYADTLGKGLAVLDGRRGAWTQEVNTLCEEVLAALG